MSFIIAGEAEQFLHCALRLPRTLRVLAMTGKCKGRVVKLCSWIGDLKRGPLVKMLEPEEGLDHDQELTGRVLFGERTGGASLLGQGSLLFLLTLAQDLAEGLHHLRIGQ